MNTVHRAILAVLVLLFLGLAAAAAQTLMPPAEAAALERLPNGRNACPLPAEAKDPL